MVYHTTMPTDALRQFRDAAQETVSRGLAPVTKNFWQLGESIRGMMESKGLQSVAAQGFKAPGVAVYYTDDAGIAGKFRVHGVQIAAGVPFKLDEPEGLVTFRIGLVGIDKVEDIDSAVGRLATALDACLAEAGVGARSSL